MESVVTEAVVYDRQRAWDKFEKGANELINSGNLDELEVDYKTKVGHKVAAAREAILRNEGDWPAKVKSGLAANFVHSVTQMKVRGWIDESPNDIVDALRAIWTKDKSSTAQRIRVFCRLFPHEVVSGTGTRTNVVSALLMGLNAEQFPPFEITVFNEAYKRTGFSKPQQDDEAALYEHALTFLDQLIDDARGHGVHLRHRLDAQSVVWQLLGELPPLGVEPQPRPDCNLSGLAGKLLLGVALLEEIRSLLMDKRQIILQGPPGTGKTYVAQELAHCLAGE